MQDSYPFSYCLKIFKKSPPPLFAKEGNSHSLWQEGRNYYVPLTVFNDQSAVYLVCALILGRFVGVF